MKKNYRVKRNSAVGQWLADFCWAMNMMDARRFRRQIGFSERVKFDAELRPPHWPDARIAYPDAVYHITVDDVIRAMEAAAKP